MPRLDRARPTDATSRGVELETETASISTTCPNDGLEFPDPDLPLAVGRNLRLTSQPDRKTVSNSQRFDW